MTMLTAMETFDAVWLPVLLDATIKGAALLALASLVILCMRRTSAASRHAVWLLAMVGLLLLPALSTTLPSWRVLPQWCNLSVAAEVGPVEDSDSKIATLTRDLRGDDVHPTKTPAVEMPPESQGSPGEATFASSEYFPTEATAMPTDIALQDPPILDSPATEDSPAPLSSPTPAAEPASPGGRSLRSLVPWLTGTWFIGFLVAMLPILLG